MKKPTAGYRLQDGEIICQVFDGKLPKGWHDSPDKCRKGAKNANDK